MNIELKGTITVKTLIAYLKKARDGGGAYTAIQNLLAILENIEENESVEETQDEIEEIKRFRFVGERDGIELQEKVNEIIKAVNSLKKAQ